MNSNSHPSSLAQALTDPASRSAMYGFLSRLWAAEPDERLIRDCQSSPLDAALPDDFARPAIEQLEDLQADYTQLFVGPKDQLPPYQSVWQQSQFEGTAAATMRTYLGVTCGLPTEQIEMPDHIGMQFEVMRHLLASVTDQCFDKPALRDLVCSYFHDCLTWTVPLTSAVANRATTEFFASVARLTAAFLADEASRFGLTP